MELKKKIESVSYWLEKETANWEEIARIVIEENKKLKERHQATIKGLREWVDNNTHTESDGGWTLVYVEADELRAKLNEIGGKDDNSAIERIRGGKNDQ